jgi:outer membrane protein assembly factor BamE (lipoprotein component of BamABCDE complex)
MKHRLGWGCLLLSLVALLGGCSIFYKTEINQGTIMSEEMIQQIKIGTSKQEVIRIVGGNAVVDPFHGQQWNFVYMKAVGDHSFLKQTLRLTFDKKDLVSNIDTKGEFLKEDRSAVNELR